MITSTAQMTRRFTKILLLPYFSAYAITHHSIIFSEIYLITEGDPMRAKIRQH